MAARSEEEAKRLENLRGSAQALKEGISAGVAQARGEVIDVNRLAVSEIKQNLEAKKKAKEIAEEIERQELRKLFAAKRTEAEAKHKAAVERLQAENKAKAAATRAETQQLIDEALAPSRETLSAPRNVPHSEKDRHLEAVQGHVARMNGQSIIKNTQQHAL